MNVFVIKNTETGFYYRRQDAWYPHFSSAKMFGSEKDAEKESAHLQVAPTCICQVPLSKNPVHGTVY